MKNKTVQSAVQVMLNVFQAQGLTVKEANFFGIPVSEYFGRSEKGIWRKILDDATAVAPVSKSVGA